MDCLVALSGHTQLDQLVSGLVTIMFTLLGMPYLVIFLRRGADVRIWQAFVGFAIAAVVNNLIDDFLTYKVIDVLKANGLWG